MIKRFWYTMIMVFVILLAQVAHSQGIKINCGGPALTTIADGSSWEPSTPYLQTPANSDVNSYSGEIAGTNLDEIYRSNNYKSSMLFEIPVSNGQYEVNLHFAEIYYGGVRNSKGVGTRVFNVDVEGGTLNNLDVLAEAGPATALVKSFTVDVQDQFLSIALAGNGVSYDQNAIISGIEIIPGSWVITNTDVSVTLNWDPYPLADPPHSGFRLYDSSVSGQYNFGSGNALAVVTDPQATQAGPIQMVLPVGQPHYFVLTAYRTDPAVESGPSNEVVIVPEMPAPPALNVPSGLNVVEMSVTWRSEGP